MPDKKEETYIWDTIDLDDDFDESSLIDEDYAPLIDEDFYQDEDDVRESENEFERHNFSKFRKRVRLFSIIIIACLVGLVFVPLINIKTVSFNETNFVNPQTILDTNLVHENQKLSFFELMKVEYDLKKQTGLSLKTDYDWKNKDFKITINEKIPLIKYGEYTYYRYQNKIDKAVDFPNQVGELVGFEQEQAMQTIEQLGYLNYNILKEISSIEFQGSNEQPNRILLCMNDGNYIFINIEQISDKLPYYNQMTNAVNAMMGPESKGIFHLDYGDYYEAI